MSYPTLATHTHWLKSSVCRWISFNVSSMASRPIPGVESPKQPAVRVRLCVCQRIGHAHTAQRGAPNRLTHMQDLKDVTNNVHYENYRSRKLAAVTYNGVDNNKNKGPMTKFDTSEGMSPLAQMEEERREHVTKMEKMEMEMEQVFEMKVKEKIQKLKDSELELQRRHEQMKKNLEAQHKELEEKRRQLEDEKHNWEAQQRVLEQQKLDASRTLEKNKKKKIF
ncbi:unnamed protein product [Oncorhynchus mykiss]|uniref:Septin-type G domain-containing protein n=1 Tax=Oncorhynchus mykiss TaxID=8022 RepID=A0A060YAD1_ONCMY|nr:unnamed protein product [Oncorhynchus mykiss]